MAQEEEREEPNASDVHQLAGAIDFDHVSFQYEGEKEEGSGRYIIQDLSLHIDQAKRLLWSALPAAERQRSAI